jgi:tetratricopeptide (TPR) repeat protein
VTEETSALKEVTSASTGEDSSPKTQTIRPAIKELRAGMVIADKYKLIEELGRGGMGVVYKAEQFQPIKRSVAFKIIKLGMDTHRVIARFETEKQALAVMDHPNIAKVFDAGATETGRPYFVMELVQGLPLSGYCDRHNLTTRERLELFIPICQAVQHAHQKGVIHRDLKPSNVIVSVQEDKPVPKIIDFGIAKATGHRLTEQTLYTEQGQLIGTPEYMSPEQAEMTGLDVDTRTDIYSLGVMLYELLVGVLPFDAKTLREGGLSEIQRIIREVEPLKASTRLSKEGETQTEIVKHRKTDLASLQRQLRGDLDWITLKAMAKDRTRRYATASELASDIANYLRDEPIQASPPSTTYRMRKYIRRHKTGVIAAGVVALALVIGITGTSIGLIKARRAEKKARIEAETARQVSGFLVDLFEVSDPNEAKGNSITAREILDKGAQKINRELESQPLVQARLMNTMGLVYHNLGLYGDARSLLEESLAIRESALGAESKEVAKSLEDLGNNYLSEGDHEKARQYLERSLELRKKIFGPEHTTVASTMNNLANNFQAVGNYEEARAFYERSIAIWEGALGPDSLDLAAPLNNLGLLLYKVGNYEQALQMYERALRIKEKEEGVDHPKITDTLHNLGMLYSELGEREKARHHFERALEITEKAFGPEHPYVADTRRSLGILYAQSSEYEKALTYFQEVLEIDRKAFGESHALVGSDTANLGLLNFEMGNYAEARPLLERGAAIKEKALGPEHPLIANDKSSIAGLYMEMGDYKAARPLFQRALEIREKAYGSEHTLVASSLSDLGLVLTKLGRIEDAKAMFEKALALQEKILGPEHLNVTVILNRYANLFFVEKKYEKARSMYKRALEVNEKTLGAEHPEVAVSLKGLGEIAFEENDHRQAEEFFMRALSIQEKKFGSENPRIVETLEGYAKVLRKLGQKEEARELEGRAAAIKVR